MKTKILAAIIAALVVLCVAAVTFLRAAYVVPVLMYHYIKQGDVDNALVVTPENFARQMRFLKRYHYTVVSLDALVAMMKAHTKIPPGTICITFDDGIADNYEHAYPVLRELGFPAAIFVYTSAIGAGDYLTREEMREMADTGIEIGSHTKTHYWLGSAGGDRAREEIAGSKTALEEITQKPVRFFSYPGGGFTKETRQMVIDAGYAGAVATNPGRRYPSNDVYAMKRLRISRSSDNLFVFWIETSGYYTWIKEHRDAD